MKSKSALSLKTQQQDKEEVINNKRPNDAVIIIINKKNKQQECRNHRHDAFKASTSNKKNKSIATRLERPTNKSIAAV